MIFSTALRGAGARSLAVFGDSITVGLNASRVELSWPMLLAADAGISDLRNRAISGTILQGGAMADGHPRPDNGLGRYRAALIESGRSDGLAILYGYNDARYIGAPDNLNAEAFRADYRAMLESLLAAGYAAEQIVLGSPPYASDTGLNVGSVGFTGQSRAGFERYVRVVEELAGAFGLYYAPVYERMAEQPDGALASPDITHPNDGGHRIIARAFIGARVR